MIKREGLVVLAAAALLLGCNDGNGVTAETSKCTDQWYQEVESFLSDGGAHGPDFGSSEWRFSVEHRLGIKGSPELPDSATDAWCAYIDKKISEAK